MKIIYKTGLSLENMWEVGAFIFGSFSMFAPYKPLYLHPVNNKLSRLAHTYSVLYLLWLLLLYPILDEIRSFIKDTSD